MRRFCCVVWLGLTVAPGLLARGQEPVTPPDASVGAALASLATRASSVFLGQVVSITRTGGVVEIAFRVEASVAGSATDCFVLREWAGLWPPGQHRYWLGERALVFVHAASAAGLATPVDGAEGVVPALVQGPGAPPLLDVRRLAARMLRQPTEALEQGAAGAMRLSDAVATVQAARERRVLHEPRRLPLPILPVRTPFLAGAPEVTLAR